MDILSEVAPVFKRQQKKLAIRRFVLRIIFAGIIGIVLGNMFFGGSSLDTLSSLDTKNDNLRNEIRELQAQNAKLQKEYFELKNIQGF